ncbi:TetR/AcrR family transcriptional regulator [Pseudooceanicola sp. C21-150M6]|uniref:TetR/AcrR family transcriptional regulator n=1 Tax=Pseudooceanicola sp. C21-150M6 TaxID=3434355 RepID=UPI003D7F8C97
MTSSTTTDSPTAIRRRREVAEAARAEIAEKGFEGLRMRDVAERAGINVATLDYHVGGKEGLIAVIAASIVEDFRAQYDQAPRDDMTAAEGLLQEMRDFRSIRLSRPDIHPVMASLSRRAPNDPAIARHILPLKQHWLTVIETLMTKGREDGSLRANIDPPAAARTFIMSLVALGSPEQSHLNFRQHAAEILRSYATDPDPLIEGLPE